MSIGVNTLQKYVMFLGALQKATDKTSGAGNAEITALRKQYKVSQLACDFIKKEFLSSSVLDTKKNFKWNSANRNLTLQQIALKALGYQNAVRQKTRARKAPTVDVVAEAETRIHQPANYEHIIAELENQIVLCRAKQKDEIQTAANLEKQMLDFIHKANGRNGEMRKLEDAIEVIKALYQHPELLTTPN